LTDEVGDQEDVMKAIDPRAGSMPLWAGMLCLAVAPGLAAQEGEEREERERGRERERVEGRETRRAGPERLEGILRGLANGIEALRALERREEAEVLERIAAEVRAELGGRERGPGEGERRARSEREEGRRQLEIMQLAREALLEAERPNEAEVLERAIRALEVTLEGRRDEEAARIRESAPDRGARIEVLAFAERILRERGRADGAEIVGRLVRELAGQEGRRRAAPERGERARPGGREVAQAGERAREREERRAQQAPPGRDEAVERRLRRVEAELAEVTAALERLLDERRERARRAEREDEDDDEAEQDDDDEDDEEGEDDEDDERERRERRSGRERGGR
jgi:hypothetical protein